MIVGLGIDIVSIERISGLLERHGGRAKKRLFTETEPIILLPSSGLRPYLEKYMVAIRANIPGAVRSGYLLLGRLC